MVVKTVVRHKRESRTSEWLRSARASIQMTQQITSISQIERIVDLLSKRKLRSTRPTRVEAAKWTLPLAKRKRPMDAQRLLLMG